MPITPHPSLITRNLGLVEYLPTWAAMREFTARRDAQTPDELWILQHPPVYTLGQAGKPEHLLHENGIPLVKTDRGGQITYHGPGQIVAYILLDVRRQALSAKTLVRRLEQAVIDLLAEYNVTGERREKAPGIYVNGAKIAALGLKIKSTGSYHGLSFNADMDLTPFDAINPCGYQGLRVTQARDVGIQDNIETLSQKLAQQLIGNLCLARG
ncbi:MAG: lipoyl(octanoyl) transferase LipB [Sulfuricellaceae bacterium]